MVHLWHVQGDGAAVAVIDAADDDTVIFDGGVVFEAADDGLFCNVDLFAWLLEVVLAVVTEADTEAVTAASAESFIVSLLVVVDKEIEWLL